MKRIRVKIRPDQKPGQVWTQNCSNIDDIWHRLILKNKRILRWPICRQQQFWQPLRAIWLKIRSVLTSDRVWIQTLRHSNYDRERFEKLKYKGKDLQMTPNVIIFEDRLGQGQARPIVKPDLDPNCLFKNKKPLFRKSNILRKETMQSKAALISVENNSGPLSWSVTSVTSSFISVQFSLSECVSAVTLSVGCFDFLFVSECVGVDRFLFFRPFFT